MKNCGRNLLKIRKWIICVLGRKRGMCFSEEHEKWVEKVKKKIQKFVGKNYVSWNKEISIVIKTAFLKYAISWSRGGKKHKWNEGEKSLSKIISISL